MNLKQYTNIIISHDKIMQLQYSAALKITL